MFGELHARALRENEELKLRVAELEAALRRIQCETGASVEAHDIINAVIGTPQRPRTSGVGACGSAQCAKGCANPMNCARPLGVPVSSEDQRPGEPQ